VLVGVTDVEADATAWVLLFPAGATSATIPQLPSSATLATDIASGELDGRVTSCELDPAQPGGCQRQATSRAFQLVP
jgi:hypothetical protein